MNDRGNPWTAGPGELESDRWHDEDDYDDARCEDCGAGPDENCTDDCGCTYCVEGDEDDEQDIED